LFFVSPRPRGVLRWLVRAIFAVSATLIVLFLLLALGVRLEITEDDELPPGAQDPQSAEAAMYATYRWLSAVQDSLVTALLD
jgi:predicted secreted protein